MKDKILPGMVLTSRPILSDLYLSHLVVMIIEHNNKKCTKGVVLNYQMHPRLVCEYIASFPESGFHMYIGGKKESDKIKLLHKLGSKLPLSKKITEDIYLGGSVLDLYNLILTGEISETKEELKFFKGCIEWPPGVLNLEIKSNIWFLDSCTQDVVFGRDTTTLWEELIQENHKDIAFMTKFPYAISLN